jgi:RNA polymerase-binding transcription factor DksA
MDARVAGNVPRRPGVAPITGTIRRMDSDPARGRLEEERVRLTQLRDDFVDQGLTSESENDSLGELSSVDQHQADVGTETFQREADLSLLEQVQSELADVEHALRRLDDGTYGTCEACGKPIEDGRLEALPAARFCLDDQARAEREVRLPGGNQ